MTLKDSQIAFEIPSESKERYLEWVPNMKLSCGFRTVDLEKAAWNTDNDPIIVIDRSYFSQKKWSVVSLFLSSIGAQDVTNSLK